MNILYISDSAIPSSSPNSVHVMKMGQAFATPGHNVTVMGKNTTFCLKGIKDIYGFYAVKDNFKVDVYPPGAFKGSGMFYNLSLSWRLMFRKADLFYTRSITAAFFLLLFNKKVVFEAHEPYEGKGFRLKGMFRFIIFHKQLTKLVVISGALKEYYQVDFSMPAERIFVAHDGADVFPDTLPVNDHKQFTVGYVGSLYAGKGMEILIPLAQACPQTQFHIIGGSALQIRESQAKAETLGVKNLVFHGFKSQRELPGYIVSFDALIAPYTQQVIVSEKKGANNLALWMSPLKIFEYMSAGKPIIATDLPVIREILQDDQTALLCDPDVLETWVAAVGRLSADRSLGERLSKNALQLFLEKYTWTKRAEQILAVVERL